MYSHQLVNVLHQVGQEGHSSIGQKLSRNSVSTDDMIGSTNSWAIVNELWSGTGIDDE